MERTLVIIKPDGLRRRLAGKIIQRFEEKGFSIVEMRQETMSRELAMEHYHHLVNRSFFPELISYMTSGPVVYIVLEGEEVIDLVRKMVGATKAADAAPERFAATMQNLELKISSTHPILEMLLKKRSNAFSAEII